MSTTRARRGVDHCELERITVLGKVVNSPRSDAPGPKEAEGDRRCAASIPPPDPKIEKVGVGVAGEFVSSDSDEDSLRRARMLVYSLVVAYWKTTQREFGSNWMIRRLPSCILRLSLPPKAREQAEAIGAQAAELGAIEASYKIGLLYTSLMPIRLRSKLGAHYTPPSLCERLLDLAAEAGTDWQSARILDPACGGGAFLSPLARRMALSLEGESPETIVEDIQQRLRGYEIDPFAAWMSQVFLDVTLGDLCLQAGTRLKPLVRVCNALNRPSGTRKFDLVIGNPPYGRITLPPKLRSKYQRSLFGHANLYGVFSDLALRLTRPRGVIAYVTPTSFLSGEYFKALRMLIGREAPPVNIDFVSERKGIFPGVLQETLLATYQRGRAAATGTVCFITNDAEGRIEVTGKGNFNLPVDLKEPWLIPRSDQHDRLLSHASQLTHRLSDYGYSVSTGPLVWNRHKKGLRNQPGKGRYPLVWAESVRSDGFFEFRAKKRNHQPFFEPKAKEHWVVTHDPCVLLQRTTAKEQRRRLIAAELPEAFIQEHGAVVVENHLNMIKPLNGEPIVPTSVLAALLNSAVVDQVFRCINGSVAVSAYELEALPLPDPSEVKSIGQLLERRAQCQEFEQAVERLYNHGAQ